MIAGRKLLVADDSLAYRKVIDLTFTDEGMEVTTATDGREAWESLGQSVPDVILADVVMPGLGGYDLCRLIKQNEQFSKIPVMLLVGLYEPFDEAEARRVGADDFVTKPFQSIRQLVTRVGSLLSGQAVAEEASTQEPSTLPNAPSEAPPASHPMPEKSVAVFDAPAMPENASSYRHDVTESACAADMDLQTADTMRLNRIEEAPTSGMIEETAHAHDDAIEMEPAIKPEPRKDSSTSVELNGKKATSVAPKMSEQPTQQIKQTPSAIFDDSILDLGDFSGTKQRAIAEDVILNLDYEEPTTAVATASARVPELTAVRAEMIAGGATHEVEPVAVVGRQEWSIVTEASRPAELAPVHVVEENRAVEANLALSPETIDAIARRTVEHLSERVVREIAWEVVPELAELMIKKKLEERE